MTISNQVIINLSEKKTGTSFVFQLFRDNFTSKNSKEIFVPGLKEYYFFPEQTENYRRLPETVIEQAYTLSEKLNRDDIVFMMNILAFDSTGFTEKYYRFKGLKNRDEQVAKFKESINLCFERFHFLHRYATKSHKSIYISDTNFQKYLLDSHCFFQNRAIKTFNKNFGPTKFFCVIRDPKASIISLLKTQPENLKDINEDTKLQLLTIKHHVARYNHFKRLKKLLENCNPLISSILLLDFDYLTTDPKNAFKVLCEFLELPNNGEFVATENPNPSKELSKEFQDDLLKLIPLIDEQINQQIDTSDYKKLSEEKFAVLDLKKNE